MWRVYVGECNHSYTWGSDLVTYGNLTKEAARALVLEPWWPRGRLSGRGDDERASGGGAADGASVLESSGRERKRAPPEGAAAGVKGEDDEGLQAFVGR